MSELTARQEEYLDALPQPSYQAWADAVGASESSAEEMRRRVDRLERRLRTPRRHRRRRGVPMSMAVTDPHTFETSTFETCSACGVLYTVEDGPACDCDGRYRAEEHDVS